MEEFTAPLALRVDASDPAKAAVALDQLAKSAGKAEAAANDLADSSRKLSAAEKAVADEAQRAMAGVSHLAAEQEAAVKTGQRLNQVHGSAVVNTKALNQATLNLSRQFTDIGVQLAGGQSPFLVLTQQLPQVADAFSMAKSQGLGFKALISGMVAEVRPLLITFGPWVVGLAAVGAGVYYLVDQHKKQAQALKDLNAELTKQRQELEQISPLILNSGHNADAAADGLRNFDQWLRNTNISLAEQNKLLRENTLNKLNEKAMQAAEAYSKAQKAFDKLNKPGPVMASAGGAGGFSAVAPVQAKDPKDNPFYKEAAENLRIAKESYDAINEYRNKAYLAPEAAFGNQAAGASKASAAVRDLTAATDDYVRHAAPVYEDQLLKAANEIYPEAARAAQAYTKQQAALKDAANDNIRTFDEQTKGQIRFSSTLENVAYDLENAADLSRTLRYDVQDIADAINRNDWTSAFASMARVLMQVKAAFDQGATSAQKYAAAAGAAQAIGGAVGGTGGAAISGAASGAMAGFTLGGPIGAVVGGVIGGALGIFGSSKAKKKARQQAAAQAAAEEAQRQQQIADYTSQFEIDTLRVSGNEGAAVAMERAAELAALAKLSPALVELKQKYYDAADAAEAAAKAAEKTAQVNAKRTSIQDEIDKLTLSSSELLAASRAKERAEAVALDPTLGELIDKLFGLQDAAAAAEAATASAEAAAKAVKDAYEEQQHIAEYLADEALAKVTAAYEAQSQAAKSTGEALAGAINQFNDWSDSLKAFSDSLNGELGVSGAASYGSAKQRLLSAAGAGDYANIEALGKAFLEASKATSTSTAGYRSDVALVQSLAMAASSSAGGMPEKIAALLRGGAAGFATGGSFEVGGSGAPDSKLFNLALSPGEMVNVTRPGASNDNSEIAALRAQVAALQATLERIAASNDKMERTLTNVTEGGRAMQTEVAS
jgi:hypothetical protein